MLAGFEEQMVKEFGFSPKEAKRTTELFEYTTVATKEYFLKEGEVSSHMAIIISGLFRTFYMNENGDEITTRFHEPRTLIISVESFNNKTKSKENIICLDDANLLIITLENWNQLVKDVPHWQKICRQTGDSVEIELMERVNEFQTSSAKERYQKFVKEHPYVYQKATLGQIASYLGIDIATLSRIRKHA